MKFNYTYRYYISEKHRFLTFQNFYWRSALIFFQKMLWIMIAHPITYLLIYRNSCFCIKLRNSRMGMLFYLNLVEIRIPKKFSVCIFILISFQGILKIFNLTPWCIPMDILAWTDCVRSSAGNIISDKIIQTSLQTVCHVTEL